MSERAGRRVEPLAPPPGQFDLVLSRATQRRQRRAARLLGVTAVFLAGLGGGMSVDGGVTAVPSRLVEFATDGGTPTAQAGPVETSTAASDTPDVTASPEQQEQPAASPTAVASTAPPGVLAVHGRALSTDGTPLGGLYVYAGRPGTEGFVPTAEPAGVTAEDGTFALLCPGTPVLLSSWPLNVPAGDRAATARWASTFVGGATQPDSAVDAPCSRKERVTDTVLAPGSAVAGTVEVPAACDDGRTLSVWLYEQRSLRVQVGDVRDGDGVRVAGLPPGRHTVAACGELVSVTVGGGLTVTQDVTFGCDSPSPTPTGSPTGTPVYSPSPTPLPTVSATPEPTPTATAETTATSTPRGGS